MENLGLVFSLAVFFPVPFQTSEQWSKQNITVTNNLKSVFFTNSTYDYEAGNDTIILKTSDPGMKIDQLIYIR